MDGGRLVEDGGIAGGRRGNDDGVSRRLIGFVGIGVSCSADRQAHGRIDADGVWLEELESKTSVILDELKALIAHGTSFDPYLTKSNERPVFDTQLFCYQMYHYYLT